MAYTGPVEGYRKNPNGSRPVYKSRIKNAYPYVSGLVLTVPTSTGDFLTNLIMPAQGWFGRGIAHCSNPGTGTDTPLIQWYSQASAAGAPISNPYVDANGALFDWDCASTPPSVSGSGFDFACEGVSLTSPIFSLDDGKQLFLNVTFGGGTHTGSPNCEWAIWLVF